MKYKVTPRGWVVFSIMGLLLLYGILLLFGGCFEASPEAASQLEHSSIDNDLANDNEKDDDGSKDDVPIDSEEQPLDQEEDAPENEEDDISQNETDSDEDGTETDSDEIMIPLDEKTILYFDKNIANFTDEHKAHLQKWVDWLRADLSLSITVEGHINGFPYYDDGNFGLSIAKERAQVIKDYLVKQGIDENRIQTKNMGSTDQAVLTDDLTEHHLNRRAIIYFNN